MVGSRSEMANGFNWPDVYARLEQTRRALETGENLTPEGAHRILSKRALVLAKPLEQAPAPTEILDLLVFSLSGERFGIETAHVVEVVPLEGLTPVPCAPAFVLGVVNYRGRILAAMDFRRLLDLAAQEGAEGGSIVVVDAGGMTFGIVAETVVGTIRVAVSAIAPPPAALAGERRAFIQGVTGDMVAVLDMEQIVSEKAVLVQEEC